MVSSFLWALGGTQFIFFMTALGASLVFFFRGQELRFQKALLGFAGGVMTAASVCGSPQPLSRPLVAMPIVPGVRLPFMLLKVTGDFMFITASIGAGFTEISVERVWMGAGGRLEIGSAVGASTVISISSGGTMSSGVSGSSGGVRSTGSSSIGGMSIGKDVLALDETAVTTQRTITNSVGTTIAVSGAERRWSSILASLYSRVSRGILRP